MITVVVGVGPGLGMALAGRFGREAGSEVALVARRPDALSAYAAELADASPTVSAHPFPADVADEESLRGAFAAIREQLGDPDVLIYNASLNPAGTPGEVAIAEVEQAFRVGALGALVSLQEVLPAMRARDAGSVLVTGGGLGIRPWPGAPALGMGKAAVRNLVQAAARDLSGTGIHVATVTIMGLVGAPGFEPATIAERFWTLHTQPRGSWETEVLVET